MKQTVKKGVMVGAIMMMGILFLGSNTFAAGSKSTIQVSATVVANVSQTLIHQRQSFSVTQENVAKGYVDLPAATVLQVRTNDLNGYMLYFEIIAGIAKEIWIMDNSRTTVLSGGVGFILQAYPGPSGEVKEISYRIFLVPDTKPGLYAWPLSISASLQ